MKSFFEIGFTLGKELMDEDIKFTDITAEIHDSANQYNSRFAGKKRILFTSIDDYQINSVIEIMNGNINNIDLRTIKSFLSILQDNLSYRLIINDTTGILRIKEVNRINSEKYLEILSNVLEKNRKLFRKEILNIYRANKNIEKEELFDKNNESFYEIDGVTRLSTFELDNTPALDELIGVSSVKEDLLLMDRYIDNILNKFGRLEQFKFPYYLFNTAIVGENGTGKLTIAKNIFKLFCQKGIFKKDELFIIDKDIYLKNYRLDDVLSKLERGVIYIKDIQDMLTCSSLSLYKESIDTVTETIWMYREKFIFIFSDTEDNINRLLQNEFFKRKVKIFINIPRINECDCFKIANKIALEYGYLIDRNAEEIFYEIIRREKENLTFKNIHSIRKTIENAISNKVIRSFKNNKNINNDNLLTEKDFIEEMSINKGAKSQKNTNNKNEEKAINQLNTLIGLDSVKNKIKEIKDYLETQNKRNQYNLTNEKLTLHMLFTGNPGTGKTTVARILGRLLYEMGLLRSDNVVEVTREHLVGKYVGHTSIKTSKLIDKALGGVLFIDEAYSLYNESQHDFGYEAVTTLVKRMEDDRGNFVTILAGYPNDMQKMINMNPGLKDRIQFSIHFPDYTAKEMLMVFKKFCSDNEYKLTDRAEQRLFMLFNKINDNKGQNFGNARFVRKCFDRIKIFQAKRIEKNKKFDKNELISIINEDIIALENDEVIKNEFKIKKEKIQVGFKAS